MRRILYICLLRLHPAPFRRRFAKEMLLIFDDPASRGNSRGLFTDAVISLSRQWVLRPEFRNADADAVVPAVLPVFASIDDRGLRPVAVLYGGVMSLVLLCAVVLAIGNPGMASRWLIGAHRPGGALLPATRSSMEGPEPDTRVTFPEPENPWHALASAYFKGMPVLEALDTDHDLVISTREIAAAPAMLRRLDTNSDGKLSPGECGLFLGWGAQLDPAFLSRMRKGFMGFHPVLAVLDTDHDGEISADEIANSPRSLRGLDINGDGVLTPAELMPHQTAGLAASIFGQLDLDHDGRISSAEWGREESSALREILMSADRNHDGFTTMTELTEELLIRRGANQEPKAASTSRQTGRGPQ